mgnify:CR=1 FL=1
MYPPTRNADHRTNRRPPTFGTTLLFAAIPLAVTLAATFPTATVGLVVGLTAGAALQR